MTTSTSSALDELCVNTIRTLSMDAVEKAKSGHPGAPMALAPLAYVLYTRLMKHSPEQPDWFDRDRFVLSAGHASMLLYSTLYLSGYGLTLEDLERFRQLNSPTAGHPEYGHAHGIEATTGPLGQGLSMSVGLALAEAMLAARFNRPGHEIIDHGTYVIASDGDIQEGVSSEACSLAGHLGLGKLTVFYDNNHIQLAGETAMAFSEDVGERFDAYGWHVQDVGEDMSLDRLAGAAEAARDVTDRPSLVMVRSHIGYGSPHKQDTSKAHGSPLGEEEVALTKEGYGWDPDAHFLVPDEVQARFREVAGQGGERAGEWEQRLEEYRVGRARGLRGAADGDRRPAAGGLGLGRAEVPSRGGDDRHPQGLEQGDPVGRGRGASARERLGRPRALHADPDRGRRVGGARATTAGATSTTACASTPWARSSTASTCTACGPSAPPSSTSWTT